MELTDQDLEFAAYINY